MQTYALRTPGIPQSSDHIAAALNQMNAYEDMVMDVEATPAHSAAVREGRYLDCSTLMRDYPLVRHLLLKMSISAAALSGIVFATTFHGTHNGRQRIITHCDSDAVTRADLRRLCKNVRSFQPSSFSLQPIC